MATPSASISGVVDRTGVGDAAIATWALTTADHTGVGIAYENYQDRTYHVFGTFGGATVVWEGSLDGGTTWGILHDPQGNATGETVAQIETLSEAVPLIRPRLSVVGSGAAITCALYMRRS